MNQLSLNLATHFKLPTGILGAAVTNDGTSLAAACMDGVYLANLKDKSFEKINEHSSYVSSAEFINDESTIVTAGYDGRLQWYDLSSKSRTRELQLHEFWSWDMAVSPDRKLIASVTGQYLAGGYKYEPAAETEPCVRILSADTGEILLSLPHVPSVQAVAFSPDNQFVAAGNLMGEVRVWNVNTGELAASWTTSDFTSWGIIKSHSYLGGIFSMAFTPDSTQLLLAGMGPMNDPMAGNGRQLWQKWAWQQTPPAKIDETHKDESGEGLMETLSVHPDGNRFVMGGRLRGGDWNVAMFELESGNRIATLKTGYRVTQATFSTDGSKLILVGTQGQPNKTKEGSYPKFGRIEVYDLA